MSASGAAVGEFTQLATQLVFVTWNSEHSGSVGVYITSTGTLDQDRPRLANLKVHFVKQLIFNSHSQLVKY